MSVSIVLQVTNMEKRIDTLSWKIKEFERVLFSDNETPRSVGIFKLQNSLMCHYILMTGKYYPPNRLNQINLVQVPILYII